MNNLPGLLTQRRSQLLQIIIIGGALCALPLVGFLTNKSTMFPILILMAGVAPIGAYVLLKHIELGLVAMLLAGVFMRFRLPTGTASEIVISLLLCGVVCGIWLVRMITVEKRVGLKAAPINVPLLAFMATVFASLAWSQVYRDSFVQSIGSPFVAVVSAMVIVFLPLTSLLVFNLVEDERWLQVMVWLFLAEGAVGLFLSLIVDLGIGPSQAIRRLVWYNGLVWINTHGVFHLWHVSFALTFAFFHQRLRGVHRAALVIYAAGWMYWGFFLRTSWLSGWIPLFAVGAVIAVFRSKKLLMLVLIALLIAGSYYWRTAFEAESEESGHTRLAAYEVNWRITGKHLVLGTGPAGYASYYMTYFPLEGMATHNNYIDIVAQMGVVGLFFLLWFFATHLWNSFKIRRSFQGRGDFAECLSIAVLAGSVGCMVAMALGDWLFPFAYTQGIAGFDSAMFNWFFMGSIWALNHIRNTQGTVNETKSHQGRKF